MGLDMYVYTTRAAFPAATDFDAPEDTRELHYWRKHPDLQGWMEALYVAKGEREASFNCVAVALSVSDLDKLEADIRAQRLPDTDGIFFGDSDGTEIEGNLAFIVKARAAIAAGCSVYYMPSW